MDARTCFPLRFLLSVVLLAMFSPIFRAAESESAGLSVLRCKFYRIHSDLDREIVDDLARRMDAMYEEYDRRWSDFRTEKSLPAMEVYVFRRQEDYNRFAGDGGQNSGGVFIVRRNILAVFLEGQGRDALRRTLQHEAFHQFAHNTISPDLPIWLNEGLAQLFEEGIWTGQGFLLGQVPPRRLRQLRDDIEKSRLVSFDDMLTMTPQQWLSTLNTDRDAGITQYNQAWAMVHFLVHAADASGKGKYRARLIHMLELLHNGTRADDAFITAFSANTKGFQDRFVEFAGIMRATPEASMVERQEVLADFVMELKRQGRQYGKIADLRNVAVGANFSIEYTERGMKWSTDPNVNTYFSDMTGRLLDPTELYFSARPGAVLPDIICRPSANLQLRTRFHRSESAKRSIEHEVIVESPGSQASVDQN